MVGGKTINPVDGIVQNKIKIPGIVYLYKYLEWTFIFSSYLYFNSYLYVFFIYFYQFLSPNNLSNIWKLNKGAYFRDRFFIGS